MRGCSSRTLCVVEAETRHDARAEILQHHVRAGDEAARGFAAPADA